MADSRRSSELLEKIISIRYHTKVTKGGRNLSFGALVAVGDGEGSFGLGYGKARGVPMAIEKAVKEARKDMKRVSLIGDTIAHDAIGRQGSTRVVLRPASPGTGVKAGAPVRAIMSVVGIHNVLSKAFGQNNPLNVAKATAKALRSLRSVEEVQRLRGIRVHLRHPQQARVLEKRAAQASDGEPAAQTPAD